MSQYVFLSLSAPSAKVAAAEELLTSSLRAPYEPVCLIITKQPQQESSSEPVCLIGTIDAQHKSSCSRRAPYEPVCLLSLSAQKQPQQESSFQASRSSWHYRRPAQKRQQQESSLQACLLYYQYLHKSSRSRRARSEPVGLIGIIGTQCLAVAAGELLLSSSGFLSISELRISSCG